MVNTTNTYSYPEWLSLNPEEDVFNEMINKYGVYEIAAKNITSTRDLDKLSENDTFGFILAFKCLDHPDPERPKEKQDENIVFIPELTKNSCATVALLNIICNLSFKKKKFLQVLLDSPTGINSIALGQALSNMSEFKKIHESLFNISNIISSLKNTTNDEEIMETDMPNIQRVYHFISFIYKDNHIWKLDGSRKSAIKLQRVEENENWLDIMKGVIRDQIELNDLNASLLAIVSNPGANIAGKTFNRVYRYLFN